MAIIHQDYVDLEIDRYGTSVVLIKKVMAYSDWGDESASTTSTKIVAVHNDIAGGEDFNREGIYGPGDKVFFCRSNQSDLTQGNEIIYKDAYYKINEVINHHLEEQDYVKEVRCGKVR